MEKLEMILHAEDAARVASEDARIASVTALSEARAKAAEVLRSGREDVRLAAEARREEILASARKDVVAFRARADREAVDTIAEAETQAEAALGAALEALRGL